MSSEHERIATIARRLRDAGERSGLRVDIGDDAAVLRAPRGDVVLSVDAAIEGTHFDRKLSPLEDIGFRAISAALSDLAAMGATARCALTALTCPPHLGDTELFALVDGLAEAQAHYACPIAGGNLSRAPVLSITSTVVGEAGARTLQRSGAAPGHGAYVTGKLGAAAAGLQLLRDESEGGTSCKKRFQRPIARLQEGRLLADIARACIDISDGLLQDLGHLCAASQVGCDLELSRLPLPDDSPFSRDQLIELALAGGDDYELLVAADSVPASLGLTRIGTFTAHPGIRTLDADGTPTSHVRLLGFDHFRSAPARQR